MTKFNLLCMVNEAWDAGKGWSWFRVMNRAKVEQQRFLMEVECLQCPVCSVFNWGKFE